MADRRRRHRTPVGKARRGGPAGDHDPVPAEPSDTAAEPGDTAPDTPGSPEAGPASGDPGTTESGSRSVVFAERKAPGRLAPLVVAVAAALFVGAGAFGAAALQPYLSHRAEVQTKTDIARTAASAITTLWTYTPDDMDSLGDRAQRYLGGDFAAQYRKYVDAIAPTNKQAQVTNSTEVVGAAVESLNGSEATAIVYTNSTATSPLTKNIPSLRYLSYRLTMHREDAKWLVTRMSNITSLDLTPQI